MFNIEERFKEEIDNIFINPKYSIIPNIERGYAVQRDIPLRSILFIGINPSYSEKKTKEKNSFFYSNHQQDEVHHYFRKFQDISKKTRIEWSHLDLLYIRQTDQKIIKSLYKDKLGNDFLERQLEISKLIIESSKPKVIVVSNAFARDLFLMKIKTEFDPEVGTHKIIENKFLEDVPVFFTSMLTGQRALDNGSYDRLIWQINFVLNKI